MQQRHEKDGAPKARLITPLFLLVMASTLAYFTAIGVITPILPRYVEGPLGGSNFSVGIVIGAFALSAVLLRPLSGRLSDQKGRRILIIVGGLLVGVTITIYVISTSLPLLVFLRFMTGVGEAFFYVGVASIINDLAPNDRRGEALSYFSLALFGGLAIGPVVGEVLLDASGYHLVWIVAGGCAALAGLLGLAVPETRPPGLENAPPGALIHKAALLPGAVLATNIWGLATFSSFIPLYALDVGLNGSRFVFVVNSAVILSIRLFGAQLPDKLGPRLTARSALSCVMVGLTLIGLWPTVPGLFIGTVIYSIGHALAFPVLMTLAINRAPEAERGSVVGTFTAFFDLSFGVGAVSAGVIASLLGYRGAFVAAGFVAFGGLMLLLAAARETPGRARVGGIPEDAQVAPVTRSP